MTPPHACSAGLTIECLDLGRSVVTWFRLVVDKDVLCCDMSLFDHYSQAN